MEYFKTAWKVLRGVYWWFLAFQQEHRKSLQARNVLFQTFPQQPAVHSLYKTAAGHWRNNLLSSLTGKHGIEISLEKVNFRQRWPKPKLVIDAWSFLGDWSYFEAFLLAPEKLQHIRKTVQEVSSIHISDDRCDIVFEKYKFTGVQSTTDWIPRWRCLHQNVMCKRLRL